MAHRARALRHPVFVSALALLAINDHVLKHAGLLPGWLTGKLSDLAGLIVAPVVLIALLGLERRRARAIAFGAVGAGFALLELSPRAAAAWDGALGALGMPSRSWPDPTDLVALAVLPVAWAIVRAGDRVAPPRGLALASQQALLGVALFACIATSRTPDPAPAQWTTDAWLRNRTAESLDVRIRWARGPLDCEVLARGEIDLSAAASPEIFEDGITFRLAPGDTVPLEPNDADAAASGTTRFGARPFAPEPRRPCELARIAVDGLDDSVVFWTAGAEQGVLASQPELEAEGETDDAMELAIDESVAREGALRLLPGSGHRVAVLRDRPAPTPESCDGARGATLGFGGTAFHGLHGEIVSRALLPDGCTMLELGETSLEPSGATESLVLCVPGDFVPFDVGDAIVIARDDLGGRLSVRDDGAAELPRELVVVTAAQSLERAGLVAEAQPAAIACAERLACGAYVAPIPGLDVSELSLPLDVVVDRTADGVRARWLVSRAEHVIVASSACDAGRDVAGVRIDAVALTETLPPPVVEGEEVP